VTEPDAHISGNTAWIAYVNKGSISDASGTVNQNWLESAFLETYKTRGDCQTPRKSYKTYQTADWVVGWEFLGKTALTLPCTDSERDSTRQPRYGGHTFECGLRRSELVFVTVKTIQQRQAPWSGSPANRTSEKKP